MKEVKGAIKGYFKNFANYRGTTGKTEYFFCIGLVTVGRTAFDTTVMEIYCSAV